MEGYIEKNKKIQDLETESKQTRPTVIFSVNNSGILVHPTNTRFKYEESRTLDLNTTYYPKI